MLSVRRAKSPKEVKSNMGCCFKAVYSRRCSEETEEFFGLQVCSYHRKCIARGLRAETAEKFADIMLETCVLGAGILADEEEEADRRLTASGWTRTKETRRSFENLRQALG